MSKAAVNTIIGASDSNSGATGAKGKNSPNKGVASNAANAPGQTQDGRRMSALMKSTSPPFQDTFRFWKQFAASNEATTKKLSASSDFVARVWSGVPDELRSAVWLKARTPDDRQIVFDEAYASPSVVQEIEEELMFVRIPQDPNVPFLHQSLSPKPEDAQLKLVPLDDTRKELIRNVLKIDASVFQLSTMRPGSVQLILRLLPVTKTVSNTVTVFQTLCRRMDILWQNNHKRLYDMVLILSEIIAELPALAEQFRRTDFSVHDLATLMKEWILPVFACHFPMAFVHRAIDVALFDPRPQAFVALIYGMIKVAMPDLLSLPPAPKKQYAVLVAANQNAPVSPIPATLDTKSVSEGFLSPLAAQSESSQLGNPESGDVPEMHDSIDSGAGNEETDGRRNSSVEQIQLQLQQTSPLLCLGRIPLITGNLTSAFAIGYDYVRSSLDEYIARLKHKDWAQALTQPGPLKLEVGIGNAPVISPSRKPVANDGYFTNTDEIKQFLDYQKEFKKNARRSGPSTLTYHPLHGVVDFFSPANDAETPLGGDLLSRLGTTLDVVDSKIRQRNRWMNKMLEEERKRQEKDRNAAENPDDMKDDSKNGSNSIVTVSINSLSSNVRTTSETSCTTTSNNPTSGFRTMSSWTDRAQELLTNGDVNRLRTLLNQLTEKLNEIESLSATKSIAGSPIVTSVSTSTFGSPLHPEFEQKSLDSRPCDLSSPPASFIASTTPIRNRHIRNESSISMVTSTMSSPQMMTPLPASRLSMGSASLRYEANKTGSAHVAEAQAASTQDPLPASISQGIVRFSALSRLIKYPCIHMEGYLQRAKLSSADLSSATSTMSTEPLAIKLVNRYYILQGPYLTQFSKRLDLFPSRDISVDLRGRTITLVDNHPLGDFGIEILTHSGSTLYLLFSESEEERRKWIASFVTVSLLPRSGKSE